MRPVKIGSTDISVIVRIVDSDDGTPELAVTSATPGLAFNYRRELGLALPISAGALSDLALLTTAHTDGGIKHIGDGYYRVDVRDDAFLAGVDGVLITGTATLMVVIGVYIPLWGYDPRIDLTTARAGYLDALTVIQNVLTPVGGTTSGNGVIGGTTVVDATRPEGADYFNGLGLNITSGACAGQTKTIVDFAGGTFTVNPPFSAQIVTGVTYRVVTAMVYQPGIVTVPSFDATVEPDTYSEVGQTIITNNGVPLAADLTVGVIAISRIRAGVSSVIVAAGTCLKVDGHIYYAYTFPAASWQAGDTYLAVMTGQQVIVNGITYPLSLMTFKGRVSREAVIGAQITNLDGDVVAVAAQITNLDGDVVAVAAQVTNLDSDVAALPDCLDIADCVWDEILAGHILPGSAAVLLMALYATMGSGIITVVSPVSLSGDLTIRKCDDYLDVDGRALDWMTIDAATWPILTGATVTFYSGTFSHPMTVITGIGVNKKVRLELTDEDTCAMCCGADAFTIKAVLLNGSHVTLANGTLTVEGCD